MGIAYEQEARNVLINLMGDKSLKLIMYEKDSYFDTKCKVSNFNFMTQKI